MKATVKGILFEASDGGEYLLGFSRTEPRPTPDPQPPPARWHLQRDREPPGSIEAGPDRARDLRGAPDRARHGAELVPVDRVQGGAEDVPARPDLADVVSLRSSR